MPGIGHDDLGVTATEHSILLTVLFSRDYTVCVCKIEFLSSVLQS